MAGIIRFIGKVTDQDGYPAGLLEHEKTGKRYLAYSAETLQQRLGEAQVLAEARSGQRHQVLEIRPEPPDAA